MRRPSATDIPATLAASTCVVVFLVCFFSLGSMPRYLARWRLAQQGQMLARDFEGALESARRELVQLPEFPDLDCHDGLSPVLAHHVFDNEFVRWLGVARNGHIVCRSPLVVVDLPPGEAHYPLDSGWLIAMTHVSKKVEALILIQTRGDVEYVVMLEPLLFALQNPVGCSDCLGYEAVLEPTQEIVMQVGDTTLPAAISSTEDTLILRSRLRLTVSATQQYVDRFKLTGNLVAAGISAIVALTLSFMLYGLLVRRTSLANLLKQGIRAKEFIPYYQPIIDARDGSVLGAEALVRWIHGEELIHPGQFIEYAEESGLIASITEQVVNNVLIDLKHLGWVNTDRYISINVVPDQILISDFCSVIVRQLAEHGIPGKNLAVEITERRPLHDLRAARNRMMCLAQAGIAIKIDDAGTGFGGFSYVQELPVTTLKIDKMFIDGLRTPEDAKRLVLDAIIQFARNSGLKTIAEGVETREQLDYLVKAEVHAIQGYVFAPPMPADEFTRWIGDRAVPSELGLVSHEAP